MIDPNFVPRVDISKHVDVTPEEIEAVQEILSEAELDLAHRRAQQHGMAMAFMALKKPVALRHRNLKQPKVTRRARLLANARARSAFLKVAA